MKIKYNWDFDRYVTEDGKVLSKVCRWEVDNESN